MNNVKKIAKALFFPHIALLFVITPVAIAFLVLGFIRPSVLSYVSYVLSAYVLAAWSVRVPRIIAFFKALRKNNSLVVRFFDDAHFQLRVSLYGALIFNIAFSVFQLGLGVYYDSLWYYSLAAYYILLAAIRFFLLKFTSLGKTDTSAELSKYRICGYVLLILNISLSVIMFFIVARGRTFVHHQITTIAIAAFTFTALAVAIVNLVKYKKYNSPVFSACKIISLVAACVSMLTLESTMLTAFGNADDVLLNKLFLGISGGAVSAFIVSLAVYMIVSGTKKLKELKFTENINE